MKYLIDMARIISQSADSHELRDLGRTHRDDINTEVQNLSDDDVQLLVEELFGQDYIPDASFYERLTDIHRYIGYEPPSYVLVGKVWAEAFNSLPGDRRPKLLTALLENKKRGFWTAVRCFSPFCESAVLPPRYAAGWFHALAERIAGDLGGGDFYNGITTYAEKFPESAVLTFEQYMSGELDSFTVHLAGILLGTARAKAKQGALKADAVKKWDRRLQSSPNLQWRLMYDKSLVSSFNLGAVSRTQLRAKLALMLKGAGEEVAEAFDVVGRCLLRDKSDVSFIRFALRWYARNTSAGIPPFAKYHLVNSLWLLCSSQEVKDKPTIVHGANDLIVAAQPVPPDHQGTWQCIERYLVSVLEYDRGQFEDVFLRLVKKTPRGLLQQLNDDNGYLKSELPLSEAEKLATKLLLSANKDEWDVGKSIFADTKVEALSHEILASASEYQLEVALFQLIRSPLLAHKTCQYLAELEPHFTSVSPELQEAFRNELVVQAINYPQACLSVWEKKHPLSKLMEDAI